jgi:hypothetical protein
LILSHSSICGQNSRSWRSAIHGGLEASRDETGGAVGRLLSHGEHYRSKSPEVIERAGVASGSTSAMAAVFCCSDRIIQLP